MRRIASRFVLAITNSYCDVAVVVPDALSSKQEDGIPTKEEDPIDNLEVNRWSVCTVPPIVVEGLVLNFDFKLCRK